jgi:protein-L-isoaspartate(D-aspartate) O-methyltransferase
MSEAADRGARAAEREEMVESQLARRGIRSEAVLEAMREIPREWFVSKGMLGQAYHDGALPVDCGQTISQPYIVARMTELLELQPEDTVLEVGTGTGYQTAILARLARHVYTIEWHLKLMNAAAHRLERMGQTNVTFRCGDGSLGWPEHAPYDAIIVTAGAPDVPQPLREQLVVGGRLVLPVGELCNQMLIRVRRTESDYTREDYLPCRFVKLLGAEGWQS